MRNREDLRRRARFQQYTAAARISLGLAEASLGRLSGVELEEYQRKILVENEPTGGCGIMLRRV
jgi:hypothetical protein